MIFSIYTSKDHYIEIVMIVDGDNLFLFLAGPWDDFSKFELSMMHINNKNDLSYVNKMKGWYLEVYKEDKYLSTSIIVVFPNDGKESDKGKNKICKLMFSVLFIV